MSTRRRRRGDGLSPRCSRCLRVIGPQESPLSCAVCERRDEEEKARRAKGTRLSALPTSPSRSKRGKATPIPDPWDGTDDGKETLHRDIALVLRAVAQHLGLIVSRIPGKWEWDCEIRSNKMGPASGGSISLLADRFHLWVDLGSRGDWGDKRCGFIGVCAVRARDDYARPKMCARLAWELLWDPAKLAEVLVIEGIAAPKAAQRFT